MPEHTQRVEAEVRKQLATVYTHTGVEIWLNGRHKLLNGERPIALINRGEGERVLAIATQLAESAYA